jgi:putative ABC transport system permease protein
MDRFVADLRHGLRLLRRTPGVTITALVALALAIGANTAMFSIVDAVLLRPLPFEDPDRVVMVWEDASRIGFPRNTPAPANWVDWRRENTVFTDIAATRGWSYNLTGDGPPENAIARRVTANFWTIAGTRPIVGRMFTEDEEKQNAKVVVLSYGLWVQRYGGETNIIGRKVLLTGEPFTVVGVMPMNFAFPNRSAVLWTPAAFTPEDLARRGSHFLQCIARLKPGVTIEQAQAEMRVIAKRLEERYPGTNRHVGAVVVPIAEQVAGQARRGLMVLFAASGFVLLIACANIANLLLSRAAAREREIAVRAALGADRAAIVRQLLTESVVLAFAGAALGIAVARASMFALEKLVPAQMAAVSLSLDWRMLVFTTLVTVATGVLFGLFPAFSLGRVEVQDALKQGGRTASGRRHGMRNALVVSQTALALALMTGAGLLIQTLGQLRSVDVGMRTENVLTALTPLLRTPVPEHARREAFFREVVDNVRRVPGVNDAGYTSALPLTQTGNTSGYIVEGQTSVEANTQDALFRVVTPGFLPAVGARVREGRLFADADRAGAQPVAIVNETFADRHWRGMSAVGRRIAIDNTNQPRWLTVAGVVKEIRERGVNIDTKPAVYMPLAQSEGYWPVPVALAVRTTVEPASIAGAVRQAVWSVDRDQPLTQMRTMEQVVDEQLSREQQQSTLLGAFAALALVLAATGIYGVISYTVSQRRREIGVRMALGASPGEILRTVFARGLGLIGLGIVLGVGLSLAASRLLSTMLFGVQANDPWTLAIAAAVLGAIALAACAAPASSAARVNPSVVLREE